MIDWLARFAAAALVSGAVAGTAQAQETFSARSGGNTSNRTGTQGVVGNPNCAPPVEIINGRRVTPLNWSCDSSGYWASRAPNIKAPSGPPHPGPAYVPGAANPCQPGGRGGYNWLDNPVGTPLPPGCVRSATGKSVAKTIAKTDAQYETLPPGSYLAPPVGPPGSYIQPDGRPGSYIVPPQGAPGSYLNSTGKGTQVHTGPGGAIVLSPGKNESADEVPDGPDARDIPSGGGATARFEPGNAVPYRQDTGPMRGGAVSNGGASPYRQDTGAMQQGANSSGGFNLRAPGSARKITGPKKPNIAAANAAANSQAARIVNGIINLFGNGP